MTGLTPDQITFGSKAKMRPIEGSAPHTLDLGMHGPCVACGCDTVRYGEWGAPLCPACQHPTKEH